MFIGVAVALMAFSIYEHIPFSMWSCDSVGFLMTSLRILELLELSSVWFSITFLSQSFEFSSSFSPSVCISVGVLNKSLLYLFSPGQPKIAKSPRRICCMYAFPQPKVSDFFHPEVVLKFYHIQKLRPSMFLKHLNVFALML